MKSCCTRWQNKKRKVRGEKKKEKEGVTASSPDLTADLIASNPPTKSLLLHSQLSLVYPGCNSAIRVLRLF